MNTIVKDIHRTKSSVTLMLLVACAGLLCATLLGGCAAAKGEAEAPSATQEQDEDTTTSADEDKNNVDERESDDEGTGDSASQEEDDPASEPELSAEDQARIEKIQADMQTAAEESGMTCGITAIDLTNGLSATYQGDQQMRSASMIKMLIAHTFLEQVKEGTHSLDDMYTLKASDIVGGTGTLAGRGAGAQVSYRDILMRMIDVSDNTGTNILIDACGMDAINKDAKRLSLKATELNRHMMDYDAIAAGLDNYTCADDMALLMRMVYEGSFVDASSSNLVMEALRQQSDWGGIRNGLPAEVPFAHKTGTHDTVRHDGGIVEGDHPFVLVVLCGGEGYWEQGALNAMANVAQVVYADIVD